MYKPLNNRLSHLRPYGNKIIWKYMSKDNFIYMIKNKTIYLPRADKNPIYFEGRFIDKDIKALKNLYKKEGIPHPIKNAEKAIDVFQEHKKYTYFDSWHLNDYECFAMWRIFGKNRSEEHTSELQSH